MDQHLQTKIYEQSNCQRHLIFKYFIANYYTEHVAKGGRVFYDDKTVYKSLFLNIR